MTPTRTLSMERNQQWLATMLANEEQMLSELGQVANLAPPASLREEPMAHLERVAAFVDSTDFSTATADARTWLLNRLGLYLARCFIALYGGRLTQQTNPDQRFYLHYIVAEMRAPVARDTRLDPFSMAYDAIHAWPRCALVQLVKTARQTLRSGEHGSVQE